MILGKLGRRRIEGDRRAARLAVEPAIGEDDAVVSGHLRRRGAAPRPAEPADFEQVGEVVAEADGEREADGTVAEIAQRQPLIRGVAPEIGRALDVQQVLVQDDVSVDVVVGIGEIDGEQRVVVTQVRAEKQQRLPVHQQLELRKVAGVAVEQTLRAADRAAMSPWLSNTANVSPYFSVRRGRVAGPTAGM